MEFTVDETKRHPHHSGPLVVIPSCIINSDDDSEYGDERVEDIDIEFEIESDNDEAENESAAEDISKSFEVLVQIHPMLWITMMLRLTLLRWNDSFIFI